MLLYIGCEIISNKLCRCSAYRDGDQDLLTENTVLTVIIVYCKKDSLHMLTSLNQGNHFINDNYKG